MSGLYTAIFGESANAATLVHWLGLRRRDFERYRDAYKTMDGEIAIYTRLGGGNREGYQHVIDAVRLHPLFKRDADDEFDSTYLTFYFVCPVIHAEDFAAMPAEPDRNTLWQERIAAMENMDNAEREALLIRVSEHTVVVTGDGKLARLTDLADPSQFTQNT